MAQNIETKKSSWLNSELRTPDLTLPYDLVAIKGECPTKSQQAP